MEGAPVGMNDLASFIDKVFSWLTTLRKDKNPRDRTMDTLTVHFDPFIVHFTHFYLD